MISLRPPRSLFACGLALAFASPLFAQQTPAAPPASTAPTLTVDARLVNLPVIVRDKKGALIQSLVKDDFVLQVDGHPETIRYFDRDTNLPLTLGLLVDTSLSQRKVIDEERDASNTFLDQMLTTPKDQAFVVQFARQVELLQDLTASRPKLQAALKQLDYHQQHRLERPRRFGQRQQWTPRPRRGNHPLRCTLPRLRRAHVQTKGP